jgi:phosphatidylglycerol:prolipoprotein diacylglycerol transferase
MFPVLIDLGTYNLPFLGETPIFLPTYGALFATSVVVAWFWFTRRARSLGIPDEPLFNLVFYTLLAGILGAKALLILVEWRAFLANPALLLGTLRSAGVLIGGLIAATATFMVYSRKQGLPAMKLADAMVAPVALAQGMGRLGCYAAGCCWGVSTHADHPLAITFTDPRASAQTGVPLNSPLIATQLIQMTTDILLAGLLTVLWRRRSDRDGEVFWVYVLAYSLVRGTIEFWRGDVGRGLYLGGMISTSQGFALAGMILAGTMLVRSRLRSQAASR